MYSYRARCEVTINAVIRCDSEGASQITRFEHNRIDIPIPPAAGLYCHPDYEVGGRGGGREGKQINNM